jgi:hypothetical protein
MLTDKLAAAAAAAAAAKGIMLTDKLAAAAKACFFMTFIPSTTSHSLNHLRLSLKTSYNNGLLLFFFS